MKVSSLTHVPSLRLLGLVTLSAFALGLVVSSGSTGNEAAAAAKAAVEARTAAQTTWIGPTTGPKTEPGKFVVYISTGENNPIGHLWGAYLQQAAAKVGWRVTVLAAALASATVETFANQAMPRDFSVATKSGG